MTRMIVMHKAEVRRGQTAIRSRGERDGMRTIQWMRGGART